MFDEYGVYRSEDGRIVFSLYQLRRFAIQHHLRPILNASYVFVWRCGKIRVLKNRYGSLEDAQKAFEKEFKVNTVIDPDTGSDILLCDEDMVMFKIKYGG